MATQRSHFSSRCVPVITANTFAVDELTEADSRYVFMLYSKVPSTGYSGTICP